MITRDEEANLARTLESVRWADEIVVVDSGSTDRTLEIARSYGARVVEAEWPGYGPQKRRAIQLARGEWVLAIDADEVVSDELGAEIRGLLAGDPAAAGYEVVMHTWFLGHWLGRRGWHRDRHLRLVRRDAARVSGATVHERLTVAGRAGRLRHPIRHYSYRDVEHYMDKQRRYARLKAERRFGAGRRATLPGAVVRGAWRFFAGYVLQGGWLDGGAGLAHEALSAHGAFLAHLRLWELSREGLE